MNYVISLISIFTIIAQFGFDLIEIREEARNECACESALKMIGSGKLTLEEISEYSGLPIEKVRELAREKTA
jgi:predicted HTH domain antitoxin